HPNYDDFWKKLAFWPYLKNPTVPDLNVAGWWDQEDFYGPVKIYELLERNDSKHLNYLVVGPWNHGGWARGPGSKLGPIDFGSNTGQYFRANIQAPWFAYWLKDKGQLPLHEALLSKPAATSGSSTTPGRRARQVRETCISANLASCHSRRPGQITTCP